MRHPQRTKKLWTSLLASILSVCFWAQSSLAQAPPS